MMIMKALFLYKSAFVEKNKVLNSRLSHEYLRRENV